ncbi:HAD family hydrolase [Thiomicrorhabdus sp. 6S3-12]|uniref:HAD family hydrolase n=1 Tax=Thiomicrorhabdus sp. 6S3-12 TaxID=2819681 RepID=UPI001AADF8EB|nr:HAD hydrolase-like protein [Thiomicrorhabdus sp. 6S3-12]MBO1922993.1 HAD family hydrolase [Thiomicrorhabdus sp. 6S3-12]
MNSIEKYQNLIFDCDGVVLNSNKIKTEAFYNVAKVYGHEAANALVDYHVQNGGVSRYRKFTYLITEILKKPMDEIELKALLDHFALEVKKALMTCQVAEGLSELRERTKDAKWFIVSGGDQSELREVFAARGLGCYFNGGIFGSPDTKDEILSREMNSANIVMPALFIGDSKYDHIAAREANLDFLFVSGWSEFEGYENYCNLNGLTKIKSLKELLL